MRVIFLGASKFGLRCLQKLYSVSECKVVGIVSGPANFAINYRGTGDTRVTNVLHADVAAEGARLGIPVWMLNGKMSDPELLARIRQWSPDLFVVAGWYHLIPRQIRDIAPAIGLHASLLPDYSGGAPLVWAIINGEKRTGITLFRMDDGIDSGDIIGQEAESICEDDTIASLYARIEDAGLRLLETHIPRIARAETVYTPQDHARRRTMPQRSPADGRIDWNWSVRRIYDFVRAQTNPYPGAYSYLRESKVTIWDARPDPSFGNVNEVTVPGMVLAVDERGILVAGGGHENSLLIKSVGTNETAQLAAVDFAEHQNLAPMVDVLT